MARTKLTPHNSTKSKAARKQLANQTAGKSLPSTDGMKQPLQRADLCEIRKHQKAAGLVTRKIPFQRLVQEIAGKVKAGMPFQKNAVLALQKASEDYLVDFFTDANLCAIHGKRVTVTLDDIHLAQKLKNKQI